MDNVGAAIGRPLPQHIIADTDEQCSPLQVACRKTPRSFDRGEVILVGAVINRPCRMQYEFAGNQCGYEHRAAGRSMIAPTDSNEVRPQM